MERFNQWFTYIVSIAIACILTFYITKSVYTSKHIPYVQSKPIVVEHIKIDTVYVYKTISKSKKSDIDSISQIATLKDTISFNSDSIILNVKYHFPPENRFDYVVDFRKFEVIKHKIDTLYIMQERIVEVPKVDYKLLGASTIIGIIIGYLIFSLN